MLHAHLSGGAACATLCPAQRARPAARVLPALAQPSGLSAFQKKAKPMPACRMYLKGFSLKELQSILGTG